MTFKHDTCSVLFGLKLGLLRANQTRKFCYSFHFNITCNGTHAVVALMLLLLQLALLPGNYSQGRNWMGVCSPLPKTFTLFMAKMAENRTPWGPTYLYSPCKAVTRPPPGAATFYNTVFLAEELTQTNF